MLEPLATTGLVVTLVIFMLLEREEPESREHLSRLAHLLRDPESVTGAA